MLVIIIIFLISITSASVTLYSECNFKGENRTLNQSRISDLESWNNKISSIIIPSTNFTVRLWMDTNFSGSTLLVTTNVSCLSTFTTWNCPKCCPCDWNNLTKSLMVKDLTAISSTTTTTTTTTSIASSYFTTILSLKGSKTSFFSSSSISSSTTNQLFSSTSTSSSSSSSSTSSNRSNLSSSSSSPKKDTYLKFIIIASSTIFTIFIIYLVFYMKRKRMKQVIDSKPKVYNLGSSSSESSFEGIYLSLNDWKSKSEEEDDDDDEETNEDDSEGEYRAIGEWGEE